nr:4/1 protein [Ipomoea batatas]
MAAISEEATQSLSSSFDHICDEFKNAIAEIQTLNSNYNAEVKKRDALQFTIKNLQSENERLRKIYTKVFNKMADQIESHTSCQVLKDELKKANDELSQKENEFRIAVESLKQEHAMRIQDLESQIRELQTEKVASEAIRNQLHQDLTVHKNHIEALARRLEQVSSDVESRYYYEIQGLRDCLLVEQEEKNEVNKKLHDLEKESAVIEEEEEEKEKSKFLLTWGWGSEIGAFDVFEEISVRERGKGGEETRGAGERVRTAAERWRRWMWKSAFSVAFSLFASPSIASFSVLSVPDACFCTPLFNVTPQFCFPFFF